MKLFVLFIFGFLFVGYSQPKASETFLLWPGIPPGALEGDDAQAKKQMKSLIDGTYKIPKGNRRDTRVPAVDVYLPEKSKQNGSSIVMYCGGGYGAVCIEIEGLPMAKFLNENGISVFMVSYRCKPFKHPVPFWDVQRAIRLVRSRADEFNIKADQIGIMGFSAGGHVTSTLSVHYKESFGREGIDEVDKISARPDFSCLIYPVISLRKDITHHGSRRNLLGEQDTEELVAKLSNDEQVNSETPPAFLAHAKTDKVVKIINSQRYHDACVKHGVKSKLVIHEKGKHGPGFWQGKPSIKNAGEDYAQAMVDWIDSLFKTELSK
ncbi:MAG: alpha/beta hydrolase [Lentisphaeraceae bacterium]|nr:alpha/beta hydrolase [Lentisphaeraceae bacterium]